MLLLVVAELGHAQELHMACVAGVEYVRVRYGPLAAGSECTPAQALARRGLWDAEIGDLELHLHALAEAEPPLVPGSRSDSA